MTQTPPTDTERPAPYAAPANVMSLIRRFRERDFPPTPFTAELLVDTGINAGMAHRTLRALEYLGLLNEAGEPTDTWSRLSRVSDDVFQASLEGVVRSAYRDVFSVVDPAKDSQSAIANVFRRYTPLKQRDKMVTLFLSLCREAGIPTLDTPRRRLTKGESQPPKAAPTPRGRPPVKLTPSSRGGSGFDAVLAQHPLIVGLLRELPDEGEAWTKEARMRWLAAAGSVVDLLFPIEEPSD